MAVDVGADRLLPEAPTHLKRRRGALVEIGADRDHAELSQRTRGQRLSRQAAPGMPQSSRPQLLLSRAQRVLGRAAHRGTSRHSSSGAEPAKKTTSRRRSSLEIPVWCAHRSGPVSPATQRATVDAQTVPPIRRQAPVTDSCSCSSSKRSSTGRIARSRTSGGCFFDADMTPPSVGSIPPPEPG
jgi:hypothetical protein